jgi:hypothetical protein
MPDWIGGWRVRDAMRDGATPRDELTRGLGDGWLATEVPVTCIAR